MSSDRADDGKFDGNVGKEKAIYGITAMVQGKLKESPLSSDAIFKQYGLLIQTGFWFSSKNLKGWPLLMCRIMLPLFPFCTFLVEKAAVHTHITEWVHSRDEGPFNQIAQNQCSLPFKPGNG